MIKLYKLEETPEGLIRLQSQLTFYLYQGQNVADFIIEDGVLKVWQYGKGGRAGFYETDLSYKIVTDKNEMKRQELTI